MCSLFRSCFFWDVTKRFLQTIPRLRCSRETWIQYSLSDSLLNFQLVNRKGIPFLINDSYNHAMSCKTYRLFHSKCTYQDFTAFSHVLYLKLDEEYRFSPWLSLLNSSVSWVRLPIWSNSSARVCAILARLSFHSRGGDPCSARNLLCASVQASGSTFKPEKNID